MSLRAVVLFCLFLFWDQVFQPVLGSEPFAEKGQKNYERDEEGKIIPHRQVNFLSFLKSEALKSEMLRDSFKTSVQFPCFFMLWNLFRFDRTFLTTVEIVVICVFTVLFVFFMVGLCIYLYIYGCTKAPWLERRSKDYLQIQMQRERKIGEIWNVDGKSENGHVERV